MSEPELTPANNDDEWFTKPRWTVTLSFTEMELLHMALHRYVKDLTESIQKAEADPEVVVLDPEDGGPPVTRASMTADTRAEAAELRQRLVMIAGEDLL
jgi:hypothetical protein